MSNKFELRVKKSDKKTSSNFSLDTGLKMQFKIEVTRNKAVMSEVLETLMESYIIESRNMHNSLGK